MLNRIAEADRGGKATVFEEQGKGKVVTRSAGLKGVEEALGLVAGRMPALPVVGQ